VRIDAWPTVENPRTRQLRRQVEQDWLDAAHYVCCARCHRFQCGRIA
jgi:hypothetical protein